MISPVVPETGQAAAVSLSSTQMVTPSRTSPSPVPPAAAAAGRLRPYVAGLAIDWVLTTPRARHKRVGGSLAFVDISGFTTLTERLAAKGKAGAEEMSELLDASFATLLARAYSYGASLVKWGGDAVLLLFEGPEHALLACRAADEMQRTMRRIGRLRTSVGVVQLKMSVGIDSGEFDFFLAGVRHRELLIAGPAATATAAMEQIAEAGEIVIGPRTAALLPPRCVGDAKGEGFLLRRAPAVSPRSRWWGPPSSVDVGTFLDPPLRAHLLAEVGESEHRQVAVGFVEVSGVDELLDRQGPGAVAHALHALTLAVQDACSHHQVTFWETDISKDGFKIMLIAGAPRSSGHDEDGMLRAARALLDHYDGPVRLRVGVNSGRVFNGGFGPNFRRTWSVKGDAINLAARVMGKASAGQLLATETLLKRVSSLVDAQPLPPFLVKGKQHPVRAAEVRSVSTERAVTGEPPSAFVGREAERKRLLDAAQEAGRGRGQAIGLTGEPGIGKSHLVDHLCTSLAPGRAVLRSFGDAYESATPYYAVRRLLRTAIGVAPGAAAGQVAVELARRIGSDAPHLAPWLPLIALPMGVDLPDTEETADLQEQFRRNRTVAAVVELMNAVLLPSAVLVVDDVHLADEASAELLTGLAAAAQEHGWLLVVVGRGLPSPLREASLPTVELTGLDSTQAGELVRRSPGGQSLAPHVISAIVERAEGKPLFLVELTSAATGVTEPGELPTTLEELLAAQVDDLSPAVRRLLRTLSVLGTRFDPALAAAVVDSAPSGAQWAQLDRFLATHADGTRRFRSSLVRDAAYEGLSFRRRVELHGRVATILRNRHGQGGEDYAEALSLHSFTAQRHEDAWHYSMIAGRRAQQVYANVEALTFYERARVTAGRLPHLDGRDVAALFEAIGDVHARLAELEPAMRAYRDARRRAGDDQLLRARAGLSAALVAERAGDARRATRWMSIAHREAAADGAAGLAELDARICVERAFLLHTSGRAAAATALCGEATTRAVAVGAADVEARALLLLDMIDLAAGRPGDEPRVHRALALFERCGDLRRQAGTWNHLGMRAYYRGEWDRAVECYARAQDAHERSGDEWSAAIASANIGEILIDQGRLDAAEPLVAEALRIWRVSGTPSDIGFGAGLLGRLAAGRRQWASAHACYAEARAAYAVKNERFEIIDVDLRVVDALASEGRTAAALAGLEAAEKRLRDALRVAGLIDGVGDPSSLPPVPPAVMLWRLRGRVAAQAGDRETAETHLRRSVEAARRRGDIHELALALHSLAGLGTADAAMAAEEAGRLFVTLGVVRPPERVAERVGQIVLPAQRAAHEVRLESRDRAVGP